jgi:hypothetical protein
MKSPAGRTYTVSACGFVRSTLLTESEAGKVLRITYSTGIKNKLSTVENNIPPTIAVPTE